MDDAVYQPHDGRIFRQTYQLVHAQLEIHGTRAAHLVQHGERLLAHVVGAVDCVLQVAAEGEEGHNAAVEAGTYLVHGREIERVRHGNPALLALFREEQQVSAARYVFRHGARGFQVYGLFGKLHEGEAGGGLEVGAEIRGAQQSQRNECFAQEGSRLALVLERLAKLLFVNQAVRDELFAEPRGAVAHGYSRFRPHSLFLFGKRSLLIWAKRHNQLYAAARRNPPRHPVSCLL